MTFYTLQHWLSPWITNPILLAALLFFSTGIALARMSMVAYLYSRFWKKEPFPLNLTFYLHCGVTMLAFGAAVYFYFSGIEHQPMFDAIAARNAAN